MGELDHFVCHQLDLHYLPTYDHGIGSREPSIYAGRGVYHDMDKESSSYTIVAVHSAHCGANSQADQWMYLSVVVTN